MAKLRLIGAVGIKVRPDTSEFREETQKGVNNALGPKGERANAKVKVEVDADTVRADAKIRDLRDDIKNKGVKLNVSVDYDGVQKAKGQIDQALNTLNNKVLDFQMNPASIKDAQAKLKKLEKESQVEVKFVRDEAGYQSILARIKKIREQKGLTSTWKFKTDTASLKAQEKLAKEGLARIQANKTITISYSKNYDGIKGAITDVDKRLDALRNIALKTKLDESSLKATKAKLLAELAEAPVTVKFNEDKEGYEKVLSRIRQIRSEKILKTVEMHTDDDSLAQWERDFKDRIRALEPRLSNNPVVLRAHLNLADLQQIENKAKELKEKIEKTNADMQIGLVGHAPVAAELAFLGRDRVVNYIARVNASSVAAAEGMLKSLGGINILSGAGTTISSLFTKFDTLSLKAGSLAAVLGSLASAGVWAGAAMFSIGEGMTQSIGLLAALPALTVAAGSSLFVLTAAFDNFVGAFSDDAKKRAQALSELPPKAREVVESFRGLFDGLQRPVQDAFWESMDGSLQGLIDKTVPTLREGLLGLAAPMGGVLSGVITSFNKMAVAGDLKVMFSNLEGFFNGLSKASEPFFDGFNAFGLKGSQLLPRFGEWIAQNAQRFDDWATTAAANGSILNWIEQGANSLQNMWQVGGSVTDMFKAITRAASLAGSGGLAQFNLDLRETADTMLGEPWQSKAAAIFDGARLGAKGLSGGFKDLTGTLGDSSIWLGKVLTQLGEIGGEGLSRLSDLLGSKTYQDGITAELEGLKELVSELSPTFKNLGDTIGNMSFVAGAVLRDLSPIFNQVSGLLDEVTSRLSGNLQKVAPKIAATVGGIFSAIAPLVLGVTDAVNALLGLVSAVPNSFVMAGVAAAAFFAMRGLASKFFDSFRASDTFKTLEGNWVAQQVAAGRTVDKYRMVNGEMQKFTVPTERFNVAQTMMGNLGTSVGGLRDQLRTLNDTARLEGTNTLSTRLMNLATVAAPVAGKAIGGLMSALGGPWGIAIAAAALGIGAFAQAQQDAKAHVDDLTASIDKQTGKLNEAGLKKIAESWTDLDEAGDAGDNFWRGIVNGQKSADETARALKLSFSDVTKTIANGGPAYDDMHGKIKTLADAMTMMEDRSGSLVGTREKADAAAAAFGLTVEELQKMGIHGKSLQHLEENIRKEAEAARLAEAVFEGLGKATGETTIQAQQMAQAMATIGDNSIDAAGKIGAINKALDLLKGGSLSAREAQVQSEQVFQTAVQQAEALREELSQNNHLISETTGLIDVTSTSGLKLQQAMKSSADGIKIAAQAAYTEAINAGKPATEAAKAATDVIAKNEEALLKLAEAANVPVEKLRAEWTGFFGQNWELVAVFSANADKFQAAREAVQAAGGTWNDQVFQAFLSANGDPAKWTIDGTKAWAVQYATDQYIASLKAVNPEALASILQATGQAQNYKDGNYTAVMKALNSTAPGVSAAWEALMGVQNGPAGAGWAAALKAYADAVALQAAKDKLDDAAKPRTSILTLIAQMSGKSVQDAMSSIPPMIRAPQGANGAFLTSVTDMKSLLGGKFPMQVKQFANGGIEQHYAQIARPSSTYRVWAEPETGGEAYIPLSQNKRGRSTAILNEVATQFGYTLQKATKFAEGGIVSGGNTKATGLNVNIGTYNQNASDTVDDVGRGIMRGIRKSSATLEGF